MIPFRITRTQELLWRRGRMPYWYWLRVGVRGGRES